MSSDRASTSSPFFPFSCSFSRALSLSDGATEGLLLSSSFTDSGEVSELCGVEAESLCADVTSDGEVGFDCAAWGVCLDCCCCWAFSANSFSRVPRSVDSSSSPSRPVGFVSRGYRRARPHSPRACSGRGFAHSERAALTRQSQKTLHAPQAVLEAFDVLGTVWRNGSVRNGERTQQRAVGGIAHGGEDPYPFGGLLFFSTWVKTQSVL